MMTKEEERLGLALITASVVGQLADAELGQCEAHDLVPTEDDAVDQRCSSTGVRIREDLGFGHIRHRTVCPRHGYEPPYTPPVPARER